jgi:hypothetical protein
MVNMNQDMIDLVYPQVDGVLVAVNKDHEEQLEVRFEKQVTKLLELEET